MTDEPTKRSRSVFLDQRVRPELLTYPLYRIRDDQAEECYETNKAFWAKRRPDKAELEVILKRYADAGEKPYFAPLARRLAAIAEALPAGEPATVIELGGANAALLHWWPRHGPSRPLRYTGIEPYAPFVADARALFPEAEFIEGDAEAFLRIGFAPRQSVTAFIAATVFCFVHPDVVRRCIHKAAALTDNLLIRDYVVNIQGAIVSEGQGHLVFDYYLNPVKPLMFAHRYEDYFREVGFAVVHMEEARTEVDRPGWALLHVRRRHG